MTCADARQSLAADEASEGLEAHLADCAGCRDAASRYRAVQDAAHNERMSVSAWIDAILDEVFDTDTKEEKPK